MSSGRTLSARVWLVFGMFILLGLSVFGRILWIQHAEHDRWVAAGENYVASVRNITPIRGQIFTSDGHILATSVPVYEVRWDSKCEAIKWAAFDAELDSLCLGLSSVLGDRTPAQYRNMLLKGRENGRRNVLVAKNVSFTDHKLLLQLPFIRAGRYKSGFSFHRSDVRRKPFGELAGRTVGIDRDAHRVGIEESWNEELAGVEGRQLQRRVPGGAWMPVADDYIVEPRPGLDLVTTIDMHLQDVAARALEKQMKLHRAAWGTVVLMEVKTGHIKAIANLSRTPATADDSIPDYSETFNHAIGTAVEPGSTMKLASLMAAMEHGGVQPTDSVATGGGRVSFHGHPMTDSNWEHGGYGTISVQRVFEVSSNVGTALTVRKAFGGKPQQFLDALGELGIGEPTGIRLPGEAVPQVHKQAKGDSWSGVSLTQMAIGYEVALTPLQILTLYNAVANNGTLVRPAIVQSMMQDGKVIKTFESDVVREKICSETTLQAAKGMLEAVADPNGRGTARSLFKDRPYRVAGKTGTARIAGPNGYDGKYRASFAGYFPADAPEYSCIVVIAEPASGAYYGSVIAAPVFQELADKALGTDPRFHKSSTGPLAANPKLPTSQGGSAAGLVHLLESFGIPYESAGSGPYVHASTDSVRTVLTPARLQAGVVPDVRGMGLRDALFLLENAGIQVRATGVGTVRNQSVPPGTALSGCRSILLQLS